MNAYKKTVLSNLNEKPEKIQPDNHSDILIRMDCIFGLNGLS